jgi:hypothetical protein
MSRSCVASQYALVTKLRTDIDTNELARLMVWEDGVELTKILTQVSVAEWVATTLNGEDYPFLEFSVCTKSYHFHAITHCVGI